MENDSNVTAACSSAYCRIVDRIADFDFVAVAHTVAPDAFDGAFVVMMLADEFDSVDDAKNFEIRSIPG